MSEEDRVRWDGRYDHAGPAPPGDVGPPAAFAPYENLLPTEGLALELACGRGRGAVWLAERGLAVWGVDVSPVAVKHARDLAADHGLAQRCRFDVADLDNGIPPGPAVDLLVCHLYTDARLDRAIVERLRPGGVLAIAVLSEVDVGPGPYRVPRGQLRLAFSELEVLAEGEKDGQAWLLGRARL